MAEKTGLSLAGMEGPVREPGDDRYGFRAIAEGLARSICALDENISTVIGIEGKWGVGRMKLLSKKADSVPPLFYVWCRQALSQLSELP